METRPDKELIGVIGAGLMGTALTERLLEHGYRVRRFAVVGKTTGAQSSVATPRHPQSSEVSEGASRPA